MYTKKLIKMPWAKVNKSVGESAFVGVLFTASPLEFQENNIYYSLINFKHLLWLYIFIYIIWNCFLQPMCDISLIF